MSFGAENTRHLSGRRGLTGTVHAHHQNRCGDPNTVSLANIKVDGAVHVWPNKLEQFFAQESTNDLRIRGIFNLDARTKCLHELFGCVQSQVRDQQGVFNFFPIGSREVSPGQKGKQGLAQRSGARQTRTKTSHA